jgi:signal transduction histidine kinase
LQFDRVGENWYLAVADEGLGIDRSQLRKIFSHFYQVDSRLSRAYPGMGTGLTLVKLFLDAAGGNILLESSAGKGTIMTVVYPQWIGA